MPPGKFNFRPRVLSAVSDIRLERTLEGGEPFRRVVKIRDGVVQPRPRQIRQQGLEPAKGVRRRPGLGRGCRRVKGPPAVNEPVAPSEIACRIPVKRRARARQLQPQRPPLRLRPAG